jgi:hypothetical protein
MWGASGHASESCVVGLIYGISRDGPCRREGLVLSEFQDD